MTRFAAASLDLSNLPPPEVLTPLDYEARLKILRDALVARFPAIAGVIDLESELSRKLLEVFAYYEVTDAAAINDASRARMLAFASGGDLEHLGAFYGVARRTLTPATADAPAVRESDAELRRRIQIAPDAFNTAGAAGAYVHHALEASAEIVDVGLIVPAPGRVDVILLSRLGDGTPSTKARAAVRERLLRDDVKPLTVDVTVRGVTVVSFKIRLRLHLKPGPDLTLVRAAAEKALDVMLASRRRIGEAIPTSAIIAAAHVSGVDFVEMLEPTASVEVGLDQVANCAQRLVDTTIDDD